MPGGRRLPHNIDAEMVLLGTILVNNRAFERVADFLKADHFAYEPHRRVFAACRKLIESGWVADPIMIGTTLADDASLAEIGGGSYLLKLANAAVAVVNARDYGRLVYDLHLRRKLIAAGEDIIARAYQTDGDAEQLVTEAAGTVLGVAEDASGTNTALRPIAYATAEAILATERAHRGETEGKPIKTGLIDLDRKIGGLRQSALSIVAARPGMGKTAFGIGLTLAAARAGVSVELVSVEMPARAIANRMLAAVSGLESENLMDGILSDGDAGLLIEAKREIDALPIRVVDSVLTSASAIRLWCMDIARRRRDTQTLVVVDYLQLLRAPEHLDGAKKHERVEAISGILRDAAKESGIAICALAQLSRAVETRTNPRPMLSDLAESGAIEKDATLVMMLHRPDVFLERNEPETDRLKQHEEWQKKIDACRNLAEVYVEKNRHGKVGKVRVFFDLARQRFTTLVKEPDPQQDWIG